MGLAGRKVKQRIPNDPRNLSWADDAARFGSNYLAKFGWDASKGLGAEGEGRLSHIKVSQKLDMMGIGAAHQKDPNGIAWKQNKDFENLLRRLNEGSAEGQSAEAGTKLGGFKKADEREEEGAEKVAEEIIAEPADGEKKKKKRKNKEVAEDETEQKKKKRKKGEDEEAEGEKTEVVVVESTTMDVDKVVEEKTITVVEVKKPVVPRHRAHRARAIAAKNISSKSAAHISEILGVAPTPSSSSSFPSTPAPEPGQGKLTSLTDAEADSQLELEKITTSTKSLADYFKEKLAAKSSGSATPATAASPRIPADDSDAYDTPRMGLGSSRARLEVQAEAATVNEATQRMGLSKFSALMSSSFLAATSLPSTFPSTPAAEEEETKDRSESEEEETEVKSKKAKKEKKGKKEKKAEEVAKEPEPVVEEKTEKKKKRDKKDKKGKDKAIEPHVEEETVAEEDVKEKKKKKKDKKRKGEESPEAASAEGLETTSTDVEIKLRKEKKEKKKKTKMGSEEVAPPPEVDKESRKDKKKKRRTSDDAS